MKMGSFNSIVSIKQRKRKKQVLINYRVCARKVESKFLQLSRLKKYNHNLYQKSALVSQYGEI
jgi:hypothetical protein